MQLPNSLTDSQKSLIDQYLRPETALWLPLPGPQLDAYVSQADELFFGGSAGGGKALVLDTPIPTPFGWCKIGALEVGDTVFDERGQPCQVIVVSPIMENHIVYEVCFDDGSILKADVEHEWLVFSDKDRNDLRRRTDGYRAKRRKTRPLRGKGKKPWLSARNRTNPTKTKPPPIGRTLTTEQIAKNLFVAMPKRKRTNYSIQVASPLQLPEADLLIPPYVLGAWLGDGTSGGQGFTSNDDEIIERIRRCGYKVVKWGQKYAYGIRGIKVQLRELGLLKNKHIPSQYLRASEQQRMELLRGLMDTDGTAASSGACEFYSCNPTLVQHTLELLLSLGFKCRIRTGRATIYGKDCGEKYRIKFTTLRRVFHLTRKAQRQVTQERGTQNWRYITDIKPIDSLPVRCIGVDSPSHLYLAGRQMIPTHNTDLLLGLAMTAHGKAIIFRREYAQLTGADSIVERSRELLSDAAQFNARDNIWRDIPGNRVLEFGAVQYEDDKNKYKGHSHDLKAFDEVSEFTESQYRFLIGWARTTDPNQRVRVVATGNPPTRAEGEWVIKYWGPWLDDTHPNPAASGELRWFAVVEGEDREVKNGEPFEHKGEIVKPKSRTFIPARLSDNPYLARTGYATVLQGLPEPLRSQLLYGDFNIAVEDNPWQVIPTEWVRLAQERWKKREKPDIPLTALGIDVARGGRDQSIISKRYDNWFAPLLKYPGSTTPNGPIVAGLVVKALNGGKPNRINVDVIGVGSSVYDILSGMPGLSGVWGVNFAEGTKSRDKTGRLGFRNIRAEAYWKAREALDPNTGDDLALPPDDELLADLVAPKWKLTTQGVQVESKEDIVKRLKRSPDCSDAFVLALGSWGGWSFG